MTGAGSGVSDLAGNEMGDSLTLTRVYDTTAPTGEIDSTADANYYGTSKAHTNVSPIPVGITFDEDVTGLEAADFTVTGGVVDNVAGSGTDWTADFTPDAEGN